MSKVNDNDSSIDLSEDLNIDNLMDESNENNNDFEANNINLEDQNNYYPLFSSINEDWPGL